MVKLIVATDPNGAIGKDNAIPWRNAADLAMFQAITRKSVIVMGSKTFFSLPKYLKGRYHVVVTRNKKAFWEQLKGDPVKSKSTSRLHVSGDLSSLLSLLSKTNPNVFVIGGAEVYKQSIPFVSEIIHTEIELPVEDADAFFKVGDYLDDFALSRTYNYKEGEETNSSPSHKIKFYKRVKNHVKQTA